MVVVVVGGGDGGGGGDGRFITCGFFMVCFVSFRLDFGLLKNFSAFLFFGMSESAEAYDVLADDCYYVRDSEVTTSSAESLLTMCKKQCCKWCFAIRGLTPNPLRGPQQEGNPTIPWLKPIAWSATSAEALSIGSTSAINIRP